MSEWDTPETFARPGRPDAGRLRLFVLRSGALGDFVLTLPVLEAIRRLFPESEVVLAARSEFCRLARVSGFADELVSEDSPEIVRLYSDAADAGRVFREAFGAFDVALSFVLSAEVRRNLLAAGTRELHCRAPRPHPSSGLHAADHLLSVMNGLGRLAGPAVPRLALRDEDRAGAEALLSREGLGPRKYLALHPGSGSRKKNWPLERFVDLARLVRTGFGLEAVVLTGPAEEECRGEIEDAFRGVGGVFLHSPACDELRRVDLVALAGVLAMSAAYVGNDSGVTHLAAAVGAKVVAIFGPTDPAVWGPRGEHVRVVRHESGGIEKVSVEDVRTLLPL